MPNAPTVNATTPATQPIVTSQASYLHSRHLTADCNACLAGWSRGHPGWPKISIPAGGVHAGTQRLLNNFVGFFVFLDASASFDGQVESEAFTHHLLAPGPERLGALRIERIGSDAGAHRADRSFDDLRHLAILAVAAADILRWGNESRPDRCRGSLRDRLPLEGRLAVGGQLGIDLRDQPVEFVRRHMAAEFCPDPARMHRRRPHTA